MPAFDDVLYDWKLREAPEDVFLILDDRPLLRYAGLWRPGLVRRACNPFDSDWNGLWDCVVIDFERLADMADETTARARFQVRRLRELRLIYPDGTRTDAATRAVAKFVANTLG